MIYRIYSSINMSSHIKYTFKVLINPIRLKEKKIPELTDEIAKEIGFDSAEDFNTKTEKNSPSWATTPSTATIY